MSKNSTFRIILLITLISGFSVCFGNQPNTPSMQRAAIPHKVELNILSLGAKGDGIFLNTSIIQRAVDSVASLGGGKIIFSAGRYLSGSIILKSGVQLFLQRNAVLLGSTNPNHYTGLNRWKAFILADNQTGISIAGKGTVDGQGRRLALNIDSLFYIGQLDPKKYNHQEKRPSEVIRPQIIEMVNCKNTRITGITLKNASCWVQTYDRCQNLAIDSIRVDSDAYWNNDGFDISDCRNVRVTNCFVNAADDGICLKSEYKDHWNDSIYIANCTVRSSASGLKFGTASLGGFKNVKIENIKVYDTFRSAVAIESVDGGTLENIEINHVVAVNTGNGIFIKLGHRNKDNRYSVLRNISIKNVEVYVPFDRPDKKYDLRGPDLAFFHNPFPCSITGIPGHPVENVVLENIRITFPGRGNDGLANLPISRLKDVHEAVGDYPEFSMFGELPAWAFYVRHVTGLTMKNVLVTAEAKDFRPAFVFDDVSKLKINKLNIKEPVCDKQIILRNVTNPAIGFDPNKIKVVE